MRRTLQKPVPNQITLTGKKQKYYTPRKPFLNCPTLNGLNPFVDIPRKIYWRGQMSAFTYAFSQYARINESLKDTDIYGKPEWCEEVFMKKIDDWTENGKINKAHWWLYELYKRTHISNPIISTPLAMRLAQLEGHPFENLQSGLAKIMLTFAYGSADMQLRFTSHLERTLAEYKNGLGDGKDANEKLMNKYKEIRKELDDWANIVLCKTLLKTGQASKIYSEELDRPIDPRDEKFENIYEVGKYIITLDPLDGSSNIKTRNIFGSIMGVYRENEPKNGRELVASAIALYGPVFSLIYSTGNGVQELVKNYSNRGFSKFEQMADGQNIKMPKKAGLVIPGGNTGWNEEFARFVFGEFLQNYKIRCAGAAVAEIASLLRDGGIFFYPAPKLRLLYEGIPLSFLVEQAGGASFDGVSSSLLDTPINSMDQTTLLFIGNEELINKIRVHYGLEPAAQ